MNQVLRKWTKICSFQFQLSDVLKISQPSFKLHIKRCHDEHKCDLKTFDIIHRNWYRKHNSSLKIFRDLTRREKEAKSYLSESMIQLLIQTFNMTPKHCKKMAERKQFEFCSDASLINTANFLKEMNVTAEHLKGAPWLLWMTEEELKMKLDLLQQPFLFKNSFDALGFTIYDSSLIFLYNAKFKEEKDEVSPYLNKIYYIGQKLNLPIDILTIKLVHAWQVLHIKKEKMDMLIEILLEFKFTPKEIVNDIWIFLHNPDQTRRRLNMLREASGGLFIKLWMCRCTEYDFQTAYARRERLKSNRTLLEVLQEDLGLSMEESMAYILQGNLAAYLPRSIEDRIRIFKEADVNLDLVRYFGAKFIRADAALSTSSAFKGWIARIGGFARARLYRILLTFSPTFSFGRLPYILRYSEKTLSSRVTVLKERGLNISGYVLQLSSRKFEEYLKRHTQS